MSRYRKIDPRIWNDEKVRAFSDKGKLAFLFVLTHPGMTSLGAMRGTLDGLAAELGWSGRTFREAIGDAIRDGMVEVNDQAAYVGLPKFLRYNEPDGPNSVKKGWVAALALIPECPEKRALARRCLAYLDGKSDDYRQAMGPAIRDTLRDAIGDATSDLARARVEQELEQEQEQDPPRPPRGSRLGPGFDAWWTAYPDRAAGKGSRKDCQAIWARDGCEAQAAVILAALTAFKACDQWRQEGGRFVPMAQTWLRQRRYDAPPRPNGPTGPPEPPPGKSVQYRGVWYSPEELRALEARERGRTP